MLKPEYQATGFWGAFENAPDEHGIRPIERKNREMMARTDKIQQDIIRRALEADDFLSLDLTKVRKGFEEKQQQQNRAPSSLSARRAASALSRSSSTTTLGPRFAAPTATAAARSRTPTARPLARRPTTSSSLTAPTASSARHAAATATSRNTLGYARGRAVSAASRHPLSTLHDQKPSTPTEKKTRTVLENLMADDAEIVELIRERNACAEDHNALVDPVGALSLVHDEDDEFKDFQLTMPE